MELWIGSLDPAVPVAPLKKLTTEQKVAVEMGRLFLVRADSPVYARSLADAVRAVGQGAVSATDEALATATLWRRKMVAPGGSGECPVYEALPAWPMPR